MKASMYPVETLIIAIKNVGPVRDGQPGVVTGYAELGSLFWKRQFYLCTFLGNIRLAVKPSEIDNHDHGYSRQRLEMPEDASLPVAEQLRRIFP